MRDNDIDVVLHLVKKSCRQWPAPLMEQLVKHERDAYKILVACILSLRTRDQTTEAASSRLFSLAADPFSMKNLAVEAIEEAISPVGFYRKKAKQIQQLSRQICHDFQGIVPHRLEDLVELSGVGRKTANLVRTVGFKKLGICVDIHVHRICNRLGYINAKSPDETEEVLRGKLPQKHWIPFNRLLVAFGQNQCTPVSPRCQSCLISSYCERVGVLTFR